MNVHVVNEPLAGMEGDRVDGVGLIAAERKRQMEQEGWTPEHDDAHDHGELARAALSYGEGSPPSRSTHISAARIASGRRAPTGRGTRCGGSRPTTRSATWRRQAR